MGFGFFMYTTRRFLEADVRQSALVGRETGFQNQQGKIALYLKDKYIGMLVMNLDAGQTEDVLKLTLMPPVDQNGLPLPGSLPYTTRLTVAVNTKICKFSWVKDFPIYSMFNTPHLVEMELKTLEEILNRQSALFSETTDFHINVDMVNPFVDLMESNSGEDRGPHNFRVFQFNHAAIRKPEGRVLGLNESRDAPVERRLTKKPVTTTANKGGVNTQAKPQTTTANTQAKTQTTKAQSLKSRTCLSPNTPSSSTRSN